MAVRARTTGDASSRREAPLGCLAVFFLFFLAVGLGAFWSLAVDPTLRTLAARSWPDVPCTIVSSAVIAHEGGDGATYEIAIRYRYEFGGKTYEGQRYSFFGVPSSGRAGKERVVRRYPPGLETVCFVNPADPSEAVLTRELGGGAAVGLFALPFILVGAGGLWYALVAGPRARARRARTALTERASGARTAAPAVAWEAAESGPATLRPVASRIGSLAGRAIFALVWNGVVGGVGAAAFASETPFFVRLFLIPFALVGLGAILWAIHGLLALSNPRVVLRVSEAAPRLGERVKLSWEVEGRGSALERLSVLLVGREEAKYRRGTDTVTDREVFYEETLVEALDPGEIARGGEVEFAVPEGSLHTFEAPNNKVFWRLVVRGTIPRWPDIADEYPLIVRPLAPLDAS